MKRFNLLQFVFTLVCCGYINGVKSQSCSFGEYVDPNGICTACNCAAPGSKGAQCDSKGQCPCYFNSYTGRRCDKCVSEQIKSNGRCCYKGDYHDIFKKDCTDCNCDQYGSNGTQCDTKSGQCPCYTDSYTGKQCDKCVSTKVKSNGRCCFIGYYYSTSNDSCQPCNCDQHGSSSAQCDLKSGQCPCYNDSYTGRQCDQCVPDQIKSNGRCCFKGDYYDIYKKDCTNCNCDQYGSRSTQCDTKSGQCPCYTDSYAGKRCDKCVPTQIKSNGRCCFKGDYYNVQTSNCEACNCDQYGSRSAECDLKSGQCPCYKDSYTGRRCDTCVSTQIKSNGRCCYKGDYYNLQTNRCEDCDCDDYGSRSTSCNLTNGQCPCYTDSYAGRRCDQCVSTQVKSNGRCCYKGDYYNLTTSNCENCECSPKGSSSKLCHSDKGGQCTCKNNYYIGRKCDDIKETTIDAKDKDFYMDQKYFRVIEIACLGFGNCDIRGIRTTGSSQDLHLHASPTITKHNTKPILYTSDFCNGYNHNGDVVCKANKKAYSGKPAKKFFVLLFSQRQMGSIKLGVKILNNLADSTRSKASLPIETNP